MAARPKRKAKLNSPVRTPTVRRLFGADTPLPEFVEPELATLVSVPPSGNDWIHEQKFDGYRGQLRFIDGKVEFRTRNGLDWTHRFHALVKSATSLRLKDALIDGEAVVMKTSGLSDFGALQAALAEGRAGLVSFYAFDVLHLDGRDLRNMVIEERKRILKDLLVEHEKVKYSEHVIGGGEDFYKAACNHNLEGIVSKRLGTSYRSGRGKDWVKTKCTGRQEFVIGGWRVSDAGLPMGALLVGYYDDDGKLQFAGKVGTGFSDNVGYDLVKRFEPHERETMPFVKVPTKYRRKSVWVEPKFVAEIELRGWTRDGLLRHPSYKGLREDKNPKLVRLEKPISSGQGAGA